MLTQMTPGQVVQSISMGSRVAEDESNQLAAYFVETENWRKVSEGEVDIVFAPKGGGKSAIYSMMMAREDSFFDQGIVLTAGENPTGATAFKVVATASPTSEEEFTGLWKIYFLTLLAQTFENYDVRSSAATELIERLREADLMPLPRAPKRKLIHSALEYVKSFFRPPASIETSITTDPATGIPILTPKITFAEPNASERAAGSLFVDDLYDLAEEALNSVDLRVWILLDRLDVAFAESPELEAKALRALFRVYRDLRPLEQVELKIFLRSDIWKSITKSGFREASHYTRSVSIEWTSNSLMQLAVQRLLQSPALCSYYEVSVHETLSDVEAQKKLFYQVFPRQIDQGSKKSATFDWCLTRTKDGTGTNAPRELIHLLSETRDKQLARNERGQASLDGTSIFERQSFREALPEVSAVRLNQTLFAEYPGLRPYMEAFEGKKTLHNDSSLATLWAVDIGTASGIAEQLVQIGFFEPRQGDYWVPFIYRPALQLVQGSAEGVSASAVGEDEDAE